MANYTPGPWQVGASGITIQTDDWSISLPPAKEDFSASSTEPWPVTEANARVMAAGPELISALRSLANEAHGFLSMADEMTHGRTNMACLRNRIDAARDLLAQIDGENR
jgi:hypothetical protein